MMWDTGAMPTGLPGTAQPPFFSPCHTVFSQTYAHVFGHGILHCFSDNLRFCFCGCTDLLPTFHTYHCDVDILSFFFDARVHIIHSAASGCPGPESCSWSSSGCWHSCPSQSATATTPPRSPGRTRWEACRWTCRSSRCGCRPGKGSPLRCGEAVCK